MQRKAGVGVGYAPRSLGPLARELFFVRREDRPLTRDRIRGRYEGVSVPGRGLQFTDSGWVGRLTAEH